MTPGSENPSGFPPTDRVPPEPAAPPSRYSFGQRAFGEQGYAPQRYTEPPPLEQPHFFGEQPYQPQPYGQQPVGVQPYPQPSTQAQTYGQHGDPAQAYGQQHTRPFPFEQQPERNPYQVTPAQYYRDQGYGDPEPAEPYHLASSTLRTPRKPSAALGITSAALVAGMLAVCLAAAQSLGAAYASIYLTVGTLQVERAQITDAMLAPAIVPSMVVGIASFVGFVGLILGIVAAASKRGRGWGVGAIILGVLAPFVWMAVVTAAVLPAIAAIS